MIDIPAFCNSFLETFDGTAVGIFRSWLSKQHGKTKWIIAADFALRDKTRPGDCFAFSIIPYDLTPNDFSAEVDRNLPRDIKSSRGLSPSSAAWLRDPRHFHFAIPMNRDRVLYDDGMGSKQAVIARKSLQTTLLMMIDKERGVEPIRRVRMALQKSQANVFNVGLFTDLTLLAIYIALITIILARETRCETISWFCDRDSMTSWSDGVLWDYASENLSGLAEHLAVDLSKIERGVAVPGRENGREIMWFDHYIRAADWLAGTLATWDRERNHLPEGQDKYIRMVEDVLADSDNLIILPVNLTTVGARTSFVSVHRGSNPKA